ncbi:hypothetical protein IU433_14580 [Nocardia puris]|uniref:Lumazine-binding protein n=1 Tax=Nocardia puris TaxID=208602 RepID=A0A366DCV4_9NOCA|nr:hypothetical protein [Nocardia puris]MBF6214979.1 hypothetical protein [Nocardia puris]MBF6364823.1 hypothetical protein [Nocardia puris]MBF6460264.1 hypothetical protein [Nocardia puris]RBO87892.1 hypothetical protein DFR74_110147 [Nocardia puris]
METTRPSSTPPGAPRPGSAPSPADQNATRPAASLAGQGRAIAPPQRVEPAAAKPAGDTPGEPGRPKKWLLAVGAAVVVAVLAVAGLVALLTGGDSPEEQVRATISDYTGALRDGDLSTLRSSTCGSLHEYYRDIPEEQFAGVHQISREQGTVPVVDSVDAIRITEDTAIAQATVYTEADPGNRTQRTFDLQRTDDGWKVCDPPAANP